MSKILAAQQRKSSVFAQTQMRFRERLMKKQVSYRMEERIKNVERQYFRELQKMVVLWLNSENTMNEFKQILLNSIEVKRQMFKQHMKARLIQNQFRKVRVKKTVMQINQRQQFILRNIFFTFKIKLNTKRKLKYSRKLSLFMIKNQVKKKIASNIAVMNTAIYNIQQFVKWFNKVQAIMMSSISSKWDQFILQSYTVDPNFNNYLRRS